MTMIHVGSPTAIFDDCCGEPMIKTRNSWGNEIWVCIECEKVHEFKPLRELLQERPRRRGTNNTGPG